MAISVIIGASDSAEYLQKVLESAEGFDEILVLDKEGLDVATSIRQAKHEWILFLYPNEIVPRKLRQYLQDFTKNPGDIHGLFIPRRNFMLGKELKNHYPDFQLRFFTRDGSVWNGDTDSLPSVVGKVDRIPAGRRDLALIHLPKSLALTLGNLEAVINPDSEPENDKAVTFWKIMSATMGEFLSEFIGRGKFLHGASGYIDSVRRSMNKFYVLARRHENKEMAEIWDKYRNDD